MVYLGINQVLELNQMLTDSGINVKIHVKDRCGGQLFELEGEEKAVPAGIDMLEQEIQNLFPGNNITLIYEKGQKNFTIQ